MKKLFTLLALSLIAFPSMGALYYTCNTPSGTNLTNSSTGGGTCNVSSATWNQPGNTIIVRSGTTLTLTADPFNLNTRIEIANGGTLVYDAGNNSDFNILANAIIVVNGTFQIDGNNVALNINSSGLLIVNAGGLVTNNGSANNDIVVNGDITGAGSIEWTGSASGSGTINGQPISSVTSPVDLGNVGIFWNGTSWVDQANNPTAAPTRTIDRAIFTGNYSSSADLAVPATWPSDGITINAGVEVSFDDNDDLSSILSVRIDGTIELVDNATIALIVFLDPNSTGQVKLTRNFTRSGWQHIGFPINGTTVSFGDLVKTGTALNFTNPPSNQTNIFYWDPSTAAWLVPGLGTPLTRPFNVYSYGAGESLSLTVSLAEFNNGALLQPYTYFNPGPTSAPINGTGWATAITDGWNMWSNPYQSYLVTDLLALPADLVGGVYVWDGSSYLTRNGGVGAAEFIGPHQAFFVRTDANSGSYSIPLLARNPAPPSAPNYFKTSNEIELNLSGQGVNTSTFIAQNALATDGFDDGFDALYFFGSNTVFNSVGIDSTAYSVNQMPSLDGKEIYLSLHHPVNNKSFTISVNQAKASAFASLVLTDLHTGTVTDLKNSNYSFSSSNAAPIQRFKLLISQASVGINESDNQSALKVWFDASGTLQLEDAINPDQTTVKVYGINGQLVASGSANDGLAVTKSGVYVVNIVTADQRTYNVKVVKM